MRALVFALVASTSLAQALPGFDLERLALNPGARHSLAATTGDGLEALELRVAVLGHYQHRPLVFTVDGQPAGAYVGSRWTAHLLGAFGITDWLEAGLALPVVAAQAGDDLSALGYAPPPGAALGAPWLSARVTFLRESRQQPLDLGLQLAVSLPLGSAAALTRDPGAGLAFAPRLGLGRAVGPVRLGAELGALLRGAAVLSPASAAISDEVGSSFTGAAVVSSVGLPVHLELTTRLEAPFTRAPVGVELLAAVRYRVESLEVSVLGGPGFGRAPGTPAFRVLAGLAWTPRFGAAEPARSAP
jgi:hypothetical protein